MKMQVLLPSDPYLIRRLLVCVGRLNELPACAQRLVELLRQKEVTPTDRCVPGEQPSAT